MHEDNEEMVSATWSLILEFMPSTTTLSEAKMIQERIITLLEGESYPTTSSYKAE